MSKRISIATLGTHGDVQPYVALGVALKRQGHSVVIGAPSDFSDFVTGNGLDFCDLGSNIQTFLLESRFEEAMGQNKWLNYPSLLSTGQKIVKRAAVASWGMCQSADCVIVNMNTTFGVDIAEALEIPVIMTALQPLSATSEFPYCGYYGPSFGPVFNKLSYTAHLIQQTYYDLPRNRLRKEMLGLDARFKGGFSRDSNGAFLPQLSAYSELITPRPRDWPANAVVTGFWQLEDQTGWEPTGALREFLDAGDAPIYIGFGSMPFRTERNSEIVLEAAERWGGRIVISKGWGGLDPKVLPSNIFAVGRAPHDRLFQHVKAVVHHGGAGTTAAGLRAGRPTFILPQSVDQPYWGRRVHEMGCGPAPVRLRKLTGEILAETLADLSTNRFYAAAAADLGARLRAEDGVGKAVEVIEGVIANFVPRARLRRRPSQFAVVRRRLRQRRAEAARTGQWAAS
jgi:sterol 3beta-glucosyltransferase